jgi:hyaluronan synthase
MKFPRYSILLYACIVLRLIAMTYLTLEKMALYERTFFLYMSLLHIKAFVYVNSSNTSARFILRDMERQREKTQQIFLKLIDTHKTFASCTASFFHLLYTFHYKMKVQWTLPLKVLYSIAISCFFVVPAMVGYALRLEITRHSFWVLGVYGTVVFLFIFLQLFFATMNRFMVHRYRKRQPDAVARLKHDSTINEKALSTMKQESINMEISTAASSSSSASTASSTAKPVAEDTVGRPATIMGLAVVGYREEPSLFTQCLESIKNLNYPDPFKVIVVIDGDAPEDKEMAVLFQKIFPQSPILVLPELLSVSFEKIKQQHATTEKTTDYNQLLRDTFTLPSDTTPVCYMQPHQGKRHAMYTAFRVLMAAGCEAVMSTDSDTKFDPNAMLEMERALYWFPKIGAAAGDVRIWNTHDSLLSFMSSLRYWMAFNIERAAQSFNRCVTCVSGPMGIYRAHVLEEILDDWINQTFLGMECTYGDDR